MAPNIPKIIFFMRMPSILMIRFHSIYYNNHKIGYFIAASREIHAKNRSLQAGSCRSFIYCASSIKPKPPSFLRYTTANLPS